MRLVASFLVLVGCVTFAACAPGAPDPADSSDAGPVADAGTTADAGSSDARACTSNDDCVPGSCIDGTCARCNCKDSPDLCAGPDACVRGGPGSFCAPACDARGGVGCNTATLTCVRCEAVAEDVTAGDCVRCSSNADCTDPGVPNCETTPGLASSGVCKP